MEKERGGPGAAYTSVADQTAAAAAASQARQAINLRVLLELRRRLKSAAEKELAVGADRSRGFREELRRGEAELRLCARLLQVRASQLAQVGLRAESARMRASQTCARLTSLERENEDLTQQLGEAQQVAEQLRVTLEAERSARHGTLDSFVVATTALINELALAMRDQSSIQARMRDLIDESQALSERAGLLHAWYQVVHRSLTELCTGIADALGGVGIRPEEVIPAERLHVPLPRIVRTASRS